MSAIAPITVNDGQATPAAHTFNPVTSAPPVYREAQAGLPINGQGLLNIIVSPAQKGLQKVRIVLSAPALETATAANAQGYTAAPKVAYTNKVDATFILPERGTSAQRKDLRKLFLNLLDNAQVVDTIDNLQQPY
jgi:hypothetical protein